MRPVTRTAAQKRTQAQLEYNAFLAGCPSHQLVDRISDKWVVLILGALGGGGSAQPAAPDAPKGCATRDLSCAGRGQPEDADPGPSHP